MWNDVGVALDDLDLDDVAAFVQIVDCGGITAAATAMRLPKSSVSRRLARLERRLGTRLLHRTTRTVTPTDAGRLFHARVSAALAEVRDAAGAAFDARETPRGTVRFSAPPDLGVEVLPRLVAAFVAEHPEVRIELDLSALPPASGAPPADLVLRAGPPVERGTAAVRLQDMAFRVYASAAYLERAGTPGSGEELARHDCVLHRADGGRARWVLHHRGGPEAGPTVDVVVRGPIATDDLTFVRRAAVAGAGLALLPRLVGEAAVRDGRLRAVLPDHETASAPLFLTHPAGPHVPLAVRALRDHLLRRFPR